jgi:hypothetical protein
MPELPLVGDEFAGYRMRSVLGRGGMDQMIMGMVKDDQAAGRVFCNYSQGLEYMVWTQNDGRLMGYVAGPVHTNVWDWWVAVHHNIGIGAAPMNM